VAYEGAVAGKSGVTEEAQAVRNWLSYRRIVDTVIRREEAYDIIIQRRRRNESVMKAKLNVSNILPIV
jgi:hypothetical protein